MVARAIVDLRVEIDALESAVYRGRQIYPNFNRLRRAVLAILGERRGKIVNE